MSQGIKTIDLNGTQLTTSSLNISLRSIVVSHINSSALFIQRIKKPMMNFQETQLI